MAFSKTFLLLGLVFAIVLILSPQVSARELAEAAQTREYTAHAFSLGFGYILNLLNIQFFSKLEFIGFGFNMNIMHLNTFLHGLIPSCGEASKWEQILKLQE